MASSTVVVSTGTMKYAMEGRQYVKALVRWDKKKHCGSILEFKHSVRRLGLYSARLFGQVGACVDAIVIIERKRRNRTSPWKMI